ncbi:MAG: sigma-70 family RNA polymerase sigma factor [Ignavibacteriae bacterium]|nr:sigma-70 family RNA polymerase sigma factor [Ignavibacteriota bacterium]
MAKASKKKSARTKKKLHPPQRQLTLTKAQLSSRAEDSELIHAAIKGNQEAYKRLMKKYYTSLTHLIYKLVHDKEEIEDLTQEAFIKAFASLKNFNEEYAFSTWLFKIATNNAIDYLRKKKLEAFSINKPLESEDSDYTFELPDSTYEPDKGIIGKQRSEFIEEAIQSLPDKYKKVILLRHKEERDYAEIAKMLKLPIGTVKAHIFRAREILYKKLRHSMVQY